MAKKTAKEVNRVEAERLKKDLNETFSTASGKRTLAYLMHLCGYQGVAVGTNPQSGEVLLLNMEYNEARRTIYSHLRQFLRPEILIDVEIYGLTESDDGSDLFD